MKKTLSIFSVLLFSLVFCVANNFAQQIEIKIVVGGESVKANNVVTPEYPPAARAVRAAGKVEVKVTIDEAGNIVSAKAVSGHPLLREASVKAAQESTFVPVSVDGKPVKAEGSLVYNFTLPDEEKED